MPFRSVLASGQRVSLPCCCKARVCGRCDSRGRASRDGRSYSWSRARQKPLGDQIGCDQSRLSRTVVGLARRQPGIYFTNGTIVSTQADKSVHYRTSNPEYVCSKKGLYVVCVYASRSILARRCACARAFEGTGSSARCPAAPGDPVSTKSSTKAGRGARGETRQCARRLGRPWHRLRTLKSRRSNFARPSGPWP
jgi:hypothetical protein